MQSNYDHPFSKLMRDYLTFKYEHNLTEGMREFNRASDVGKDLYTCYHKRLGTPYTNHPTAEGLGKMASGDVFHWFIENLLEDMGVMRTKETTIEIPELNVRGHYDVNIGGKINYVTEINKTKSDLDKPSWLVETKLAWLENMANTYPEGIDNYLIDIKSLGAYRFDQKDAEGWKPDPEHAMQLTNYYMGMTDKPKTCLLFYICRDDFRMSVVEVNPNDWVEKVVDYWTTLNEMVVKGIEPEPEEPILYNDEGFAKLNWHIMYSPYMTKMYPKWKTKEDMKAEIKPIVEADNKAVRKHKLVEGLKVKYPTKEAVELRMAELKADRKWTTSEYQALKELL